VLRAVGLGSLAQSGALETADRLNLDGLLAVWHPSAEN
jgi:hypothetical protein